MPLAAWHNGGMGWREGDTRYLPTPAEIAAAAARIRATWSPEERRRRWYQSRIVTPGVHPRGSAAASQVAARAAAWEVPLVECPPAAGAVDLGE